MKKLCLIFLFFFFACTADNSEETQNSSSSGSEQSSSSFEFFESSCECTLGNTLITSTSYPIICQTKNCELDADICFRSCKKSSDGTKNKVVTECGEQVGYKLEYYLSDESLSKEILNADNEQCAKKGDILTCYESIVINEHSGKVSIVGQPENIDALFHVGIKKEYTEGMNINSTNIASFWHDKFVLSGNIFGTNPANIRFVQNMHIGENRNYYFCSVYPNDVNDTYIEYITLFYIEIISPEYYLSDNFGTNKEMLNIDNEQCVKENDILICYGGVIIYGQKGKILIRESSLSFESHLCSNEGGVCVITAEFKNSTSVKPLEIYRSVHHP
ncbi:MAG: hypothetical protein FWC26_11695 [Fibromonadales bacterium]|nr:hypothetical protein [Fibromonadales bacterium]